MSQNGPKVTEGWWLACFPAISGIRTNKMQELQQEVFSPPLAVLSYLNKNSMFSFYNTLWRSKVLELNLYLKKEAETEKGHPWLMHPFPRQRCSSSPPPCLPQQRCILMGTEFPSSHWISSWQSISWWCFLHSRFDSPAWCWRCWPSMITDGVGEI